MTRFAFSKDYVGCYVCRQDSMQRDQLISKHRGQIRDGCGLLVGAHVESEGESVDGFMI